MSIEPLPESVYISKRYAVLQSQEPGVVISVHEYDRFIERLDGCKPSGWADLWLTGVGAGAALAVGALVGALTLPSSLSATKDVLWTLTAAGGFVMLICLAAYLTQRGEHGKDISELKKDLMAHKKDAN